MIDHDQARIFKHILIYAFYSFNPHTPVADEVVFRRFQGEGVEFSDLTDAHLLVNTNLSPSSFHFSVDFLYQDHVLSQMVL